MTVYNVTSLTQLQTDLNAETFGNGVYDIFNLAAGSYSASAPITLNANDAGITLNLTGATITGSGTLLDVNNVPLGGVYDSSNYAQGGIWTVVSPNVFQSSSGPIVNGYASYTAINGGNFIETGSTTSTAAVMTGSSFINLLSGTYTSTGSGYATGISDTGGFGNDIASNTLSGFNTSIDASGDTTPLGFGQDSVFSNTINGTGGATGSTTALGSGTGIAGGDTEISSNYIVNTAIGIDGGAYDQANSIWNFSRAGILGSPGVQFNDLWNYASADAASSTGIEIDPSTTLGVVSDNFTYNTEIGINDASGANSHDYIYDNNVVQSSRLGIIAEDNQGDTILGNYVTGNASIAAVDIWGSGVNGSIPATTVTANFISEGAASASAYPWQLTGFSHTGEPALQASAVLLAGAQNVSLTSNVIQQFSASSFAVMVQGGQNDTIGSPGGVLNGSTVGSPTGNGNIIDLGSTGYNAAFGFLQTASSGNGSLFGTTAEGNLILAAGSYNGAALTGNAGSAANNQMFQFINSSGTLTTGTLGGVGVNWNDLYSTGGSMNGAPGSIEDYANTGATAANYYQVTTPSALTWSGGGNTASIQVNQVGERFGAAANLY